MATGEAGRRGEEIRSDLWVRVETRDGGGLSVDLESKVASYYGDAIREQAKTLLAACGVTDAVVRIEDRGALPFVIAARLETAARRAGAVASDVRPAATAPAVPPASRRRLRRSRLYIPGDEPKFLVNAGLYGADGVILDLEDSVHPTSKEAARTLVRNALRVVDFAGAERMVRINPLPLGLADLSAVVPERPDMILLPKVESGDEVTRVDEEITRLIGSDERPLWLMPIVETALGVENACEIARASERVAALTLGLEDYAADLGLIRTAEGDESLYARMRIVNAARAAGVQAIDSVYGQVDDEKGLRDWAYRSRRLGFEGMGCVHPRQIGPIHEAFDPTPAEIERATAIVAAYERATALGLGVVSLGSKMIDPPVVRQALRLVALARELGLLPAAVDAPPVEPR